MRFARRHWWRSAGVRFGFAYTILFGFSAIAVVACVWALTTGRLERQTARDVDKDWIAFQEAYQRGGLDDVATAIQQRIDFDIVEKAVYLLATPDLTPRMGNLPGWPPGVPEDSEPWMFQIVALGVTVPVRAWHHTLPDGYELIIGRNVQVQEMLWGELADAIPWIMGMVTLLGVFGAVTVRRLFISMLTDVSQTAAAISAGDFASRVPMAGRGDEFDELAETINDMLDRMSRLMDGVREVSNAIAHDLRTPITRARARLEDAAREGASEADLRAAIERAIADLDGITSVFHALLRIAEIEAGARRSAFATFDLVPLLRDLAELYEAAAEERGQHLVLDAPTRLTIFGDRDMLQQAVANLLDNALKFSPRDSQVRIEAVRAAGTMMTLAVGDQGPGIPAEDRARATERFFRGESARHAPGSGLGLALVQAVAVLHGGSLRLEDNAPGLRAVITLPTAARPLMDRVSRTAQGATIPSQAL